MVCERACVLAWFVCTRSLGVCLVEWYKIFNYSYLSFSHMCEFQIQTTQNFASTIKSHKNPLAMQTKPSQRHHSTQIYFNHVFMMKAGCVDIFATD